jgi:hypothetical protein
MQEIRSLTKDQAASLRCYLAVSDVAAYALDGNWLTRECLVESARIWLARNSCTATWFERLLIANEAHNIAKATREHDVESEEATRPERLFTDMMTVNYADPLVAKIWRRCADATAV